MPRLAPSNEQKMKEAFKDKITILLRYKGKDIKFLPKAMNCSLATAYRRIDCPDTITIGELRSLKKTLSMTDEDVLQLIYGRCEK